MRSWTVAGALLEAPEGLLLVRNRRRGRDDWSPPGGVIDDADTDLITGLTREVEEETGLLVREWAGPLYEVRAIAPDLGWSLRCEVHYAISWDGTLTIADPDGIVVDACYASPERCASLVGRGARWVHEPLALWLADRWTADEPRAFDYEVRGDQLDALDVRRTA